MLNSLGLDKFDLNHFVPDPDRVIENTQPLQDEYLKLFRVRKNKLNLSSEFEMYREICNIYRMLFNVTSSIKKRFKNKLIQLYSIDSELLQRHEKIYNYRKNSPISKYPSKNIMKEICEPKKNLANDLRKVIRHYIE